MVIINDEYDNYTAIIVSVNYLRIFVKYQMDLI